MHNFAIITITYSKKAIGDFLTSINKQKDNDFHVYIVDTSENDTPLPTHSKNTTIIPIKNNGYAAGANAGLRAAIHNGSTAFCIINDDVFFDDDFVAIAKQAILDHPGALQGGKIYYAAGYEYHKDRYKKNQLGHILWYAGGITNWAHAQTVHRGVDEVDTKQYNRFEQTDFITGCLMLLDKQVLDTVGFLDESYFLYFEDADYCERAKRKNIKLYYNPEIVIWHKSSSSTGGAGSALHQKYQNKNLVKFAWKYAPLRTRLHVLKNYIFK